MNTNQQIDILIYILLFILVIIVALGITLFVINFRNKKNKKQKSISKKSKQDLDNEKSSSLGIDRQSIFNFMEFDTIDDNMIIQKNGTRFLMVIECQGVNYDLMSKIEKVSVEEGFVQFLNTLRTPIQIYIQTRSVNLENSISTYKEKLRKIEDKLNRMKNEYYEMKESGNYSKEQLDKAFFELTKQSNLYEYGRDIIYDTERMSLNKNVLNKKYYIVVPYYSSELGGENLDKAEIKNLAFSEIYTRAQSLIRTISSCGVRGRILRTNELIELLYMAYNRDEAELFGMDKAIKAGYNEINSTAPDVLDKKMRAIEKYIEEKAMEKARNTADEVINEKQQRIAQREEKMEDIINEMAMAILRENEQYLGKDVTEQSIEKIESSKKEAKEKKGGDKNGEKKTTTRGRRTIKSNQ